MKYLTWRKIRKNWTDHTSLPVGDSVIQVDEEDWDKVSRYRWKLDKCDNSKIVRRNDHKSGRTLRLANFILNFNVDQHHLVLHKNGDHLDFRKSNLEVVTRKEHCRFKRPKQGKRWKGVHLSSHGAWEAHLKINNRNTFLLSKRKFDDQTALAYDRAVQNCFNGQGYLNKPDASLSKMDLTLIDLRIKRALSNDRYERASLFLRIKALVRKKRKIYLKEYWHIRRQEKENMSLQS